MRPIKFLHTGVMLFSIAVLTSCSSKRMADNTQDSTSTGSQTAVNNTNAASKAHADISATKADTLGNGKAEFRIKNDGSVELELKVSFPMMANKSVAVHFHEHGDCSDSGKGAHGHWNPTQESHGKWGSAQYHSGDIGNINLDSKGEGRIKLSSKRWTIGGDDKTNVLNRSIIVHSGVDDYTTQPTGNSGSRIGCGVITAD